MEQQAQESNKELEGVADAADDTAEKVSKIDAAANALDTVSNKAGAAAKALAPLSAGAAAVGAASYAAALDVDNGYDIVITKTGATGEALESLQGSMENIFTSLPIDAETAGTAIGEVNTRFQLTGEELEKLSQQFIEFSEINGTDLNTSIDNVDTILNKFNVDASQAGNVLGLLTKTGQDTGLSMDTLENSLMQNGSTLKEMGLGITESVNLLAAFENNGVDATTAMAGLKKSVKNYTAEGLSTDEALQKTIDRIKNASTETEALSIAQETFGSKGFAEMAQAIREGKLSLDDLGTSLDDYGNVVQDTYESTQDPWDEAKTTLNNLKLAGSDLAGTALSALKPAIEKVTSAVKNFTDWFRNLSDGQKETIAIILAVVAALAPALLIISKVAGAISSIINVWDFMEIHPDANVREKHAKAVEAGCANNNIGYGQGDRNTLNTEAKKVNYDLSKVGLCNTDCSEFQNVCAVASGAAGVTHGSNGWTTATMRNALKAAGYKIITDSAFLKNENYCVRGAIYVKESSHTVCGLTNGTYAAQTLAKAGIGGYAGNNNYSGKGIGTAVAKCDMNIRSVAEVKSNTVYSSIKAGTKVEVLEVLANGWYKIVWAGASCGYAYTSNTNNKYYTYTANSKNNSTSTSGSSGLKQTQKPESALCFDKTLAGAYVVTADKLHMRAGAGKTKADYGTIAEGGKVHCYGYYNKEKGTGAKWLYVACGNVTGYCHSDYLKRA